jgi:hypothetical protein
MERCWRHRSNSDWFNHDELRQLHADRKSRIANLANEICLAGNEPDNLLLPHPNFSQAILEFWSSAELLDTYGNTGADLAQRTQITPALITLVRR